ncbi:MAG: outer membrane protein assembly factor BamD [bacterium]
MALRKFFSAAFVSAPLGLAAIALALAGCSEPVVGKLSKPARLLFVEAESQEDQGIFSEALTNYQKIVDENPGTRLGTLAYLKIAEVKFEQREWVEAETNYRLFLTLNPNSHLTPYVLHRILKVNHEKSFTGLIFPEREVDRDMGPNRQIMLEYKRFFLLYPKSVYLRELTPLYQAAWESLARYEMVVGDYYFERRQYHSAIGRYRTLLRNYPGFEDERTVLSNLIEAHRKNQQPALAAEMERIYNFRYGGRSNSAGAAGEVSLSGAATGREKPPSRPPTR